MNEQVENIIMEMHAALQDESCDDYETVLSYRLARIEVILKALVNVVANAN